MYGSSQALCCLLGGGGGAPCPAEPPPGGIFLIFFPAVTILFVGAVLFYDGDSGVKSRSLPSMRRALGHEINKSMCMST